MSASWSPSPLIPPFRFGTIEPEVYRGAYPKQRNLRYLKRLKLRTILSLIPDEPDEVFQKFCTKQGIRSIHLPVDKVKDNVPLTYNRAVEAVQVIIDQENLPIYIHCLDGASVTGLVVCCLRKLQTWNISSAMGEFLRYLRGGVISSEESVFVEKFSSEIEISKPIPSWLWEGQITFKKHPTLKLNLKIPAAAAAASNATNTTASSPSLSAIQMSATAGFPTPQRQQQQGEHENGSNNAGIAVNSIDKTSGQQSKVGANGSSNSGATKPGAGTGISSHPGSVPASSSTGLMNHASRSSARGGGILRDRPSNNKSIIWTDVGGAASYGGSRTTSIATPTTAAKNKRAVPGNVSGSAQQLQYQGLGVQDSSISRSTSSASDSKRVPLGIQTGASNAALPPSGSVHGDPSEAGAGSLKTSHDASGHGSAERTSSGNGDTAATGTGKEAESSARQKPEENIADNSTLQTQERNVSSTPTITKNPPVVTPSPVPAAQEVVDEYYEVSMTLKALALEGADF
ncbi:tyrosine phosphatase family-domain-containing protein [Gamsiella multidivaricata]|uniref:tyrosine phosphatase family-domain-containing protein n=1 Tax=Gamsiella multidivaricata TaxID=101098 RepID=UPI00221FB66F|nr:tyrosine phosphatase family-domain-containing protein [Gamsiella multidivaricata]KAI7821937.1 tyrosine phosphatase family-domain-containing protein [Gamsiella multidivaricata]